MSIDGYPLALLMMMQLLFLETSHMKHRSAMLRVSSHCSSCGKNKPQKEEKPRSDTYPEIVMLQVSPETPRVSEGYPPEVVAVEYDKRLTVFSDSHHILQDLLIGQDLTEMCQFNHDPECTTYPEIYRAWKAAGQEDNCPMVALIPGLQLWAVGFGGKANATRAVKLALALTVAPLVDPTILQSVATSYPIFGQLLNNVKPAEDPASLES